MKRILILILILIIIIKNVVNAALATSLDIISFDKPVVTQCRPFPQSNIYQHLLLLNPAIHKYSIRSPQLILLFIGPYLTLPYFNQLYLFPYLDKLRKFSTWFSFILFFFVGKRKRMFLSPFLNFPRLAEKREQKKNKRTIKNTSIKHHESIYLIPWFKT